MPTCLHPNVILSHTGPLEGEGKPAQSWLRCCSLHAHFENPCDRLRPRRLAPPRLHQRTPASASARVGPEAVSGGDDSEAPALSAGRWANLPGRWPLPRPGAGSLAAPSTLDATRGPSTATGCCVHLAPPPRRSLDAT